MNIYDESFTNSDIYKEFLEQNPSRGNLRIRAFAAREAIPISGMKITVSKNIDDVDIVFFEGYTDESGIIERISLPAPKLDENNLDVPKLITYDVLATYPEEGFNQIYRVIIYENVCVIQNIIVNYNHNIEKSIS